MTGVYPTGNRPTRDWRGGGGDGGRRRGGGQVRRTCDELHRLVEEKQVVGPALVFGSRNKTREEQKNKQEKTT